MCFPYPSSVTSMRPLFFIHPPKCGGSSVLSFFEINAGADGFTRFVWDEPGWPNMLAELRRTGLGGGHQNYGIHLANRGPLDYVTVLRDPLKRQISNYWYAVTGKNGDIDTVASISHAEALARKGALSLDQWVAGSHDGGNLYVKMLTGLATVDRDAFLLACENIDRRFVWAGCCEDLSEFLLLLCAKTGLDLPFYSPTNVTRHGAVPRTEVSNWAAEKFMADNRFDYELYEFVRERVRQQAVAGGDAYFQALARVREIQSHIDALENPHKFTSTEHGFSAAYLASVRALIGRLDLSPIEAFLSTARAERPVSTQFHDGVVDGVADGFVRGWAVNLACPEKAVQLEVIVDGRVIASGATGMPRPDVKLAGYGTGHSGFAFPLPSELPAGGFTVRIAGSYESIRNGGVWSYGWHRL